MWLINFSKATIDDIKNILEFYWDELVDSIPDHCNMKYSHAEIVNMCRSSDTIEETLKNISQELVQESIEI